MSHPLSAFLCHVGQACQRAPLVSSLPAARQGAAPCSARAGPTPFSCAPACRHCSDWQLGPARQWPGS
ncbi:hypothetical protein E2562_032379 [Oryza meyeriana var. granulata]|uniref:Uncharacterized protein n=1 Tax=Oryza meyeriana var. granulata TaxID=110450 RepID=A0A6G1C8R4_9ORYZ|nr:hypothetical protein E2562_032379 [Oryza meyeriana var. granulata]